MINAYLVDSISIVRAGTPDAFNERPAPTVEAAAAYIEWGSKLVRNVQGEEVTAAARILLLYDATLTHADMIRIGTNDHAILKIETARDFSNVGMWVYVS